MIRVLVVDDDFRVAQIHAGFVGQAPGFHVVGTARTVAETRLRARDLGPDLLLLDVYLPDGSGLGLLRELDCDAVVLTAASDTESIRTAYRRGALGYVVKPFTARDLVDRLAAYARYRNVVGQGGQLSQADIDRAARHLHGSDRRQDARGGSSVTARLISEVLESADAPQSATQIAGRLGISRATAQRHLGALAEAAVVRVTLRYGAAGRPEHMYVWTGTGPSSAARHEPVHP
ncbi:response regulator [Yinghuangia sp. ASG 101]|uniref:response regulator n=1 Tax=Yinghuangia sp. ASG 101 TaxID=2896848 RepID=UPI001E5E5066|nr:response regulator [Yinghuangia sp. ASG 101]UGQ12015.1 response regulator [Yinghuangia sp. ASG 101]